MDYNANDATPFVTTFSHAAADPFRLLVEAVKDYGIFMLDPAGNVSSWNPGAEKIKGYKAEEIVGQNFSCFYTAEDLTAGQPKRGLRIALEKGCFEEEGLRVRKDGATFWAIVTITNIHDAFGQHVGFANVTRDITERKQAENDLRQSEEHCRGLIESIPALVWVYDAAGRPLLHNHRWYEYTGQRPEDIAANRWHEALHPDDAAGAVTAWDRCKASGEPYATEYRIRRTDGAYRWFLSQGTAVMGPAGIEKWVGICTDIDDRKRAEDALRLRDRAIQAISLGVLITDPSQPDNPIIYVSPGFERLTGYECKEVLGRNCRFLQGKDTDPAVVARLQVAIQAAEPCSVEFLNYRKDGTPFWNELSISPVRDMAGRLTHFVGVQADVTGRRKLEEQFHQAQKMEAVGQLAGGVAHDFNNLLTVISGYSELLLGMLPANDPKRQAIKAISEAGARAAGLTRQLLFFSRQAVLETKVLDLNDLVKETEKLLGRMIGEDILLTAVLDPKISRVRVDPGQIGQVLMNLAVNARDAMPQGGKLTIETVDIQLDEAYAAQHSDCKPGHYVKLAVSDNGCGMTADVKAHVFEPFFTTKGPGKGTGLGLATVYGIVKQSGGSIDLYTEPGLGTTFKIYLPAVTDPIRPLGRDQRAAKVIGGTETILVVEDEDAVRAIALLALQSQGYTVLHAESGKRALAIIDKHQGRLNLLVTDVVMPGLSGRELAETLGVRYPGLRVLYLSGYTDDSVIRHGILQAEVAFLQKPYTPLELARKVREVLDSK